MRNENNIVCLKGQIHGEFVYNHEVYGEKFFKTSLDVMRSSGAHDYVPLLVSERLVNTKGNLDGLFVKIEGDFRSFMKREKKKVHCHLFVFVKEWEELEYDEYENNVYLNGIISKKKSIRKTPFGREITDIIVSVDRQYGKTDYIPTLTWGRNAECIERVPAGTRIEVNGRIQSREYRKQLGNGLFEDKVAYELSSFSIELKEGEEE
jgi:primosomal replication protein N